MSYSDSCLTIPSRSFPGQVQAGKFRVAALQNGHDAQRLFVMVETAMVFHQAGQSDLAGMTEGAVPQVMRQADRFYQVFVGAQGAGDGPPNLGHFQGMGQAGAVIIPFVVEENLGLIFQAAEGGGMQDPVPVALKDRAIFRLIFRIGSAFGSPAAASIRRQTLVFRVASNLRPCVKNTSSV